MSAGLFEESEILVAHIPVLSSILEDLKKIKFGEGSAYRSLLRTENGAKLFQFVLSIENLSNLKLPAELQKVAVQNGDKFQSIINDIDYLCHWLILSETQLKIFHSQVPFFDIRWSLPATSRICMIFNFYVKSIVALQSIYKDIIFCWICYKFSGKNPTTICQIDWIEKVIICLKTGPMNFITQQLSFLKQQFSNLLTLLSPIFTQMFGLHTSFDWSLISSDSEFDTKHQKSTLPSSTLLILQQLTLFRDTVFCYSVVFPESFEDNIQFSDLLSRMLCDCPVIHLTTSNTMSISEFFRTSPDAPILNESILVMAQESFNKSNSSNLIRLNILISLFCDFEEKIELDQNIIALKTDEILALLGIAYYELMSCLNKNMDDPAILSIISHINKMLNHYETYSKEIQRIFLYSIVTIDVPYLDDLLRLFGRSNSSSEKQMILLIKEINQAISTLDLEKFDKGVRYDFYPLYVTHGRMIHYSLTKLSGGSSYLSPILEHLLTIRRHLELCENPVKKVCNVCPLEILTPFLPRIRKLFSSSNISELPSISECIAFFKYIPVSDGSIECFKSICDEYLNKTLNSLLDVISPRSKHVQISKQSVLLSAFQPNVFIPYSATNDTNDIESRISSYSMESSYMNKIVKSISFAKKLPELLQYGEFKVNLQMKFVSTFFPQVCSTLVNNTSTPAHTNKAILYAIQYFKQIFEINDIPFESTILSALRSSSQLQSGGTLNVQNNVFNGSSFNMTSQFLSYVIEELEKFLAGEFLNSRYESIGRCFVGKSETNKNYEHIFGIQPFTTIIQLFGPTAGIKIDSILLKHVLNSLTNLYKIYQKNSKTLTLIEFNFYNNDGVQLDQILNDDYRKAADYLLNLGLSLVLRDILTDAITSNNENVVPGLTNVILAAQNRCGDKMKNEEYVFLEAICPSHSNHYLQEGLKGTCSTNVNPIQFFFFLGLLLANDKWEFKFDPMNDTFSHNLHLIPYVIDKIIHLSAILFPGSEQKQIDDGIKVFFKAAGAIAKEKKKGATKQHYSSFVIFIDHFPQASKSFSYDVIGNDFPYSVIRSSYKDIQ
ncbi:hypothetical protein TRFO_21117 [Tritrichomonas foetus]|uniref:Uncharacterized protein n=1 Tax=Tritrichomonas foetus TaxID=1144522 RepID=A0A1J4KF81_9EUKA|nr:hypothetical protein TRFO_21117 [Tritrichomonas foetus]|eukprot:OHT09835.1 hypothetical protein TRFO_21117 [Tritrichomonas foetus]